MYYEFYIDQFVVQHLISGCLLLMITGRVLRRKVPLYRIIAGSTVQTAGMLLTFFLTAARQPDCLQTGPQEAIGRALLWQMGGIASCILACICAFGQKAGKNPGDILRQYGAVFAAEAAVTVCFGGLLQAVWNLVKLPQMFGILSAVSVLYVLTGQIPGWIRKKDRIRTVTVYEGDRKLSLTALLDTGNSLREPLTGKPVSILSSAAAEQLLEKDWEQKKGLFLIPYHSLGTERSWMKGVLMERMVIDAEGKALESEHVVLAIYDGQISSRGDCQMILHPEHVPDV